MPLRWLLALLLIARVVPLVCEPSSSTGSAVDSCVQLPSTSVCARFYPAGSLVDVSAFACVEDAEASLKSGPTVWSSLELLTGSESSCSVDFAQLMCFAVFRPCGSAISADFCRQTLGNATSGGSTGGTCSQSLQSELMQLVVPDFATTFNCSNALFAADGVGPLVDQSQLSAPAAECQALSNTSICRGVVDYPIYVPWNHDGDQSLIESSVSSSYQSALLLADVATGCLDSLSKMLCSMAYTRCDTTVIANSLAPYASGTVAALLPLLAVPFPQLPCRTLCETVNSECATLIASSSTVAAAANCSAVGDILTPTPTCGGRYLADGGEDFPLNYSTLADISIGGVSVPLTSSCNQFHSEYPLNASSVLTCPSPLVRAAGAYDSNAILGGICATPCPTMVFTRDEWSDSDRFYTGLVIASFCTSFLLWLTWAIFPVKRQQTVTFMFHTCALVLAATMLAMDIYAKMKPSQISCRNASEYHSQSDGGMCLYQALVFFYVTLTCVAFWLACTLDLYFKIVLSMRFTPLQRRKLNRVYCLAGWGVPLALLIPGLALEAFGGSTGTPWCFLLDSNPHYLDWAIFYGPILLQLVIGSFCMTSILLAMVRSARATSTGSSKPDTWWKAQLRPFFFIFIFIFIFTFIVAYRVRNYIKNDDYEASATVWVACVISTLGDLDTCGEKPADTPNLGLWYMIQLTVAGQGLLNSAIFLGQRNNFELWYGLLTGRGVRPVKPYVIEDKRHAKSSKSKEAGNSRGSRPESITHSRPLSPSQPPRRILNPRLTSMPSFSPSLQRDGKEADSGPVVTAASEAKVDSHEEMHPSPSIVAQPPIASAIEALVDRLDSESPQSHVDGPTLVALANASAISITAAAASHSTHIHHHSAPLPIAPASVDPPPPPRNARRFGRFSVTLSPQQWHSDSPAAHSNGAVASTADVTPEFAPGDDMKE